MLVNHDIHVHTFISACSHDELATPENHIKRAAEIGLKTIGFADHLWDSAQPGASKWYAPQDYNHLCKIKEQIPSDTHGVRVLIGCESEYRGDGMVGISREVAEKLDFVLLPMSHFHMKDYVIPSNVTSSKEIAKLLVKRFREVVDLRIATGIAHPFLAGGFVDETDAYIAEISDGEFEDCFGRAAEVGVSIEIHAGMFPGRFGKQRDGFHDDTFLRVLSIAKRSGCYFHFGSDTHSLAGLDHVLLLQKYVDALGVSAEDILPLLR